MSSILQSIKKIDNNFKIGYFLQTDQGGFIQVTMSNTQESREYYQVFALKNNKSIVSEFSQLIGKIITDIQIQPIISKNGIYVKTRHVEITFKFDPVPLILCLYNEHNGYYTHECCIQSKNINGKEDIDISFRL